MSMLEASLAGAAVLIGLTGAWSPCGFSMVETIGLAGDGGRRWTTIAACATFVPGALLGGVLTFGSLSALGEAIHGAGGRLAYLVAAGIAVAAAAAEARGMRIVPQVRRQLPEGWRWTMPLPLASALYGILLGLGFTTFVLSFGVWALAGISIALGDPSAGLLIGAAFGIGRAIPVIAVSPIVDTPLGIRCVELMAERPALYRIFRLGDALTLGLAAAALATSTATAARTEVGSGFDPSATGKALAFQRPDRAGVLRFRGQIHDLPGRDPAVGGPYAAVISPGGHIQILNRFDRSVIASVPAPHAQALAVSRGWLAYLTVDGGRYALRARRLHNPTNPGKVRGIASVSRPGGSGEGGTVLRSRSAELLNPSVEGKRLLYVRVDRARQSPQKTTPPKLRQRLMLKHLHGHGDGHRVYSHGPERALWSTSLSGRRAFVTLLGHGRPRIVSAHR
ncbi:MAG: hypothetical protein AUG48_08535 [Actinobacteria bacterium 13_1_20CM_3_68_9]|nr:MAG: hypothetical protein AUG48_08535 [Actinobacteria bacterium 13_1_20CM_3_68_9]